MIEYILMGIGVFFIVMSSVGMIRMPDVFTRISVIAKGITFGVGFILLGAVFHFNDTDLFIKTMVINVFLSLSTSVATSVIGLAAYRDKKNRLTKLTFLDEMKEE